MQFDTNPAGEAEQISPQEGTPDVTEQQESAPENNSTQSDDKNQSTEYTDEQKKHFSAGVRQGEKRSKATIEDLQNQLKESKEKNKELESVVSGAYTPPKIEPEPAPQTDPNVLKELADLKKSERNRTIKDTLGADNSNHYDEVIKKIDDNPNLSIEDALTIAKSKAESTAPVNTPSTPTPTNNPDLERGGEIDPTKKPIDEYSVEELTAMEPEDRNKLIKHRLQNQ